MGQKKLDKFARLYVVPQGGHGLSGRAPAKTLVVKSEGRIGVKPEGQGYILCSYPNYPKYIGGAPDQVSSYVSSQE